MTKGYTTIMINVATKNRLTKAKHTGESYGDAINRMIEENKKVVVEA